MIRKTTDKSLLAFEGNSEYIEAKARNVRKVKAALSGKNDLI